MNMNIFSAKREEVARLLRISAKTLDQKGFFKHARKIREKAKMLDFQISDQTFHRL